MTPTELRALAERATKAPWRAEPGGMAHFWMVDSDIGTVAHGIWEADAKFAAACRNELPALLDRLDAMEAEVRAWRASDGSHPTKHSAECPACIAYDDARMLRRANEARWGK